MMMMMEQKQKKTKRMAKQARNDHVHVNEEDDDKVSIKKCKKEELPYTNQMIEMETHKNRQYKYIKTIRIITSLTFSFSILSS